MRAQAARENLAVAGVWSVRSYGNRRFRLADWPTGRLADWPTGRLADWPTGRLADWPTGRLALDRWNTHRSNHDAHMIDKWDLRILVSAAFERTMARR